MTAFTIFRNEHIGEFVDFNLPAMTGIGRKEEWVPVFHGTANSLLDKAAQCKAFAERFRSEK